MSAKVVMSATKPSSRFEPPPGLSQAVKRKRDDDENMTRSSYRGYPRSQGYHDGDNGNSVEHSRGPVQMNNRRDQHNYYGRNGDEGNDRDRNGATGPRRLSSWDVSAEDRWRCPECRVNNDLRQEFCTKCGSRASHPNDRRSRSNSYNDRRSFEGPRDSRDRNRRPPRHFDRPDDRPEYHDRPPHARERSVGELGHEQRPKNPPTKREWPPQFESAGASYIFDSRSGLFYEPSSEFFYDPVRKLYYGNKKASYFRYCPEDDPPFRAVSGQPTDPSEVEKDKDADTLTRGPEQQNENTTNDGNSNLPQLASGAPKSDKKEKKKIAICIKQKNTEKAENPSNPTSVIVKPVETPKVANSNSSTSVTPQIQKKHAADIAKWSVRGREMRDDPTTTPVAISSNSKKTPTNVTRQVSSSPNPQKTVEATTKSNPNITKTTTGQPVCMLCKRKFANVEKLQQHISFSSLHKQNLAKKTAMEAAASSKETTAYRDRAKERRVMYDDVPSHSNDEGPTLVGPNLTTARTVSVTETVRPDDNLGDGNIGNQMLQKLGWKKGKELGQQKNAAGGNKLKEDWKTIEALASGDGKRGNGGRGKVFQGL